MNHWEDEIRSLLDDGHLETVLIRIKAIVELISANPKYFGLVLSSSTLDNFCAGVLKKLQLGRKKEGRKGHADTIILMTSLPVGGVKTFIEEYLKAHFFQGQVVVILTDLYYRVSDQEVATIEQSLDIKIYKSKQISLVGKIVEITNFISQNLSGELYALFHNQDVVATVASLCFAEQTNFIHHCDYSLALGVTLNFKTHIDLHNVSFYSCRKTGIKDNKYLPLILNAKPINSITGRMKIHAPFTIASCGHYAKYDPDSYYIDHFALVISAIKEAGVRYVHIGNLPDSIKRKIMSELTHAGQHLENFTHIESVKSLRNTLVDQCVDVYMGSTALSGVTCLVEAMSAGIPILLHRNPISRALAGIDWCYSDCLIWRTPFDFISITKSLNRDMLISQSKQSMSHYEQYHTQNVLFQFMKEESNDHLIPPLGVYHSDINNLDFFRETSSRLSYQLNVLSEEYLHHQRNAKKS